ncbi:MAG: TIGR02217 family protein [Rhizobiales bacterium]|nr:TIGR02217 family protein [Hyphomicrobiales bacterium]
MAFHEVRFPTGVSLGATGGPSRRTEVVVLGSGREERNSRWADSRRSYNAGYGVRDLDDIHEVLAFFEERRGRLHAFRFKDHADFRSGSPQSPVVPGDQVLGTGDGVTSDFRLVKRYGAANPWVRAIEKPVSGSVRLAVDGLELVEGSSFMIDTTTGIISFLPGDVPPPGAVVTAGFEFDVPVRFDTDSLEINIAGFRHGAIPSIPIVEVRP